MRTEKQRRSQFLSFPWEGHLYYPSVIHCGRMHHDFRDSINSRVHGHGIFHFLLFFEGDNDFIFDGRSLSSVRGLLVLCSPGVRHSFHPQREGKTAYSEITFEYISREYRWEEPVGNLFHSLFGGEGEISPLMMLDEEGIGEFLDLQQRLQDRLEEGRRERFYESDLVLLEIFRFIQSRREKEAPFGDSRGKANRAVLLREMIRARFPGKVHLDEMAGELGWTKSYMIKKFRQEYAMTPMEFDRRLRIDAAADLIVSSNRTMEDIALSLGFYDVFHFIRTFKKYKGVTPGKYV